jgi:hypothetical protein
MTSRQDPHATDSATETHHEPHGSAAPRGAADDVPEHEGAAHAADAGHAGDDGHDGHDDHGEELGPVDVPAWAAGVVGVVSGLVVVACLVMANAPA